MERRVVWLAGAVTALALTGCAAKEPVVNVSQGSVYGQEGIRVSATALVRADPDLAVVTLGCNVTSARAKRAKADCDAKMEKIMGALKSSGVGSKDIQTIQYSLDRAYTGRDMPTMWRLTNMVQVRVRNVPTTPDVIDAAADAGANLMQGVQYKVEKLHELRAKGRQEACRVARDKANQLAGQLGARVGRLVAVTDQSQQQSDPWGWYGYRNSSNANTAQAVVQAGAPAQSESGPDDQLASGQVAVEVRIEATFAVQ